MAEQTSIRDEARRANEACTRFEADLSAFVDGERTSLDDSEIARHVEQCDGCRAFVTTLAGMSRLHLFGASQEVDLPSGAELWNDFTKRLLQDNVAKLASVLYELGKALVASVIAKPTTEMRGVRLVEKQPGSIRQLASKGQALFREHRGLADKASTRRGETLSDRRRLFLVSERAEGDEAFEAGRACLEQCLRLDTDRHEARIWLAKYFTMVGRYDRACQLLRTVLHTRPGERRKDLEKVKFFALQQLSRVYSATHQFERALELEQQVLVQAEHERNELYQAAALTNLSIYCVKLGRLDEAETAIQRLARDFPQHLEKVTVPAFRRAREFKQALLRHRSFLARLRGRYPVLFAV